MCARFLCLFAWLRVCVWLLCVCLVFVFCVRVCARARSFVRDLIWVFAWLCVCLRACAFDWAVFVRGC